jgi:hypothetical protein
MRHLAWLLVVVVSPVFSYAQAETSASGPTQAIAPLSDRQKSENAITGYYNVRSFGAQGIGTDDETSAVQAALTHACDKDADHPNGGAQVYFPAGIYAVHGLHIDCTNVLVRGAGPNTTFLQYDGPQNSGAYPTVPSPAAFILAFTKGGAFGGLRDMEMNGYTTLQPVRGIATDLVLIQCPVDAMMSFSDLALENPLNDAINVLQLAPAFDPDVMAATHGYTTANDIAVNGGSGAGMTVNITASQGHITAIKIASQGTGYALGEEVTVTQPGSGGDAHFVLGASSVFFNWFLHQIRFDGTGGYGIEVEGLLPMDGAPFALDDFTWTAIIAQPDWRVKNGYLPDFTQSVTPAGKGVIGIMGGRGYQISLSNGRVEGAVPQLPVGPGQEANLFSHEMPVQPKIALDTGGGSVSAVHVLNGGFGWNGGDIHAEYSGCTRNPQIEWIVSNSVVVGGKVMSGGACDSDAKVTLELASVENSFVATDVTGFISSRYTVPLIYSASGMDSYRLENVRISGAMGDFMNGRTGALSIAGGLTASDRHSYGTLQNGWSSQGHSFLSASQDSLPHEYTSVRAGDIVFHDASDYVRRPYGQIGAYRIVTYPLEGYTLLSSRTNLCAGNLTPSGNTWSGCAPQQLRAAQVSVNAALTFPSGNSGNRLDTHVTAVDWSTGVITTAAAGSSPSPVNFTPAQMRDSWETAPTYPTSPDAIYYQGEVIYNSAPAKGRPIWWSCTTKTCSGGSGWIDGPAYGAEHSK